MIDMFSCLECFINISKSHSKDAGFEERNQERGKKKIHAKTISI